MTKDDRRPTKDEGQLDREGAKRREKREKGLAAIGAPSGALQHQARDAEEDGARWLPFARFAAFRAFAIQGAFVLRPSSFVLVVLLLAIALAAPLVLSGFWVRVLTSIYMYGAMAQAANLITGYTGYAALGNVVFFGVGAYSTTVLMQRLGWPFWLAFPAAGVACVLFTLLVGVPLLRTRGHYFVMATIGLNLAMLELANNLEFTGGGSGLVLPVPDYPPEVFFGAIYYLMLALLLACTATVWWITGHRFGYGLRAIKEDEQAAAVMGVDTTTYKVAAWAISGAFTGLAGAGYAVWLSFIQPSTVFDILVSVKIFNILVLGGPGTLLGPIVGAMALELMDNLVWTKFLELHLLILGILVIAVVILFPRGLVDLLSGRVSLRGLFEEIKQRRL